MVLAPKRSVACSVVGAQFHSNKTVIFRSKKSELNAYFATALSLYVKLSGFLNVLMNFTLKVALFTVLGSSFFGFGAKTYVALHAFLSSWRAISLKQNSVISVDKK